MLVTGPVVVGALLGLAQPVQRPSNAPPATEAEPEAEPAPVAEEPTPAASPAPAPTVASPLEPAADPAVAPPPGPAPAPAPTPPLGSTPFGGPASEPAGPTGVTPGSLRRDYVRVLPPRMRGTGLLIAGASTFLAAALTQVVDATVFRNVGTGLLDRGFLLATAITVPLGAHMRARHDAYYDAAIGRGRREVRRLIGAGAGLVMLGGLATVASEAMWWQCAIGDEGPYHTGGTSEFPDELSNRRRRPCNYDVGRTVVDLGTAAFAAGAGMLVYGLRYRHDSRVYARAKFVLTPSLAPGRAGLALVGRF